MDNNASLIADTVGDEGKINLRSNSLILRRERSITTNATGEDKIGGNIRIDSRAIAALENSDITANSTDSRGGTVTINTQGIFGTQFRQQQTSFSDITATVANSELRASRDTASINIAINEKIFHCRVPATNFDPIEASENKIKHPVGTRHRSTLPSKKRFSTALSRQPILMIEIQPKTRSNTQ